MLQLTDKQIAEYLHRSYISVDGLWFMKIEEKFGFDKALEIDIAVWTVLPKIQARLLKPLVKTDNPVEALRECLTTRMSLEGFRFDTDKSDGNSGFALTISHCPWHDLLVKSGRENLAEKIGTTICNTVYSAWAEEFNSGLTFNLIQQTCQGAPFCIFQFRS